jgi:hypothetical protein
LNEQEHKYRCAVRLLCKWRHEWGLAKFREYLSKHKIDSHLLNGFVEQFRKNNKGDWNTWK